MNVTSEAMPSSACVGPPCARRLQGGVLMRVGGHWRLFAFVSAPAALDHAPASMAQAGTCAANVLFQRRYALGSM